MLQSRWARLERCEAQAGGRGEIITIVWHPCQTQASVEALARRQLDRAWRAMDVLILIEQDECPQAPHMHDDRISISPRIA